MNLLDNALKYAKDGKRVRQSRCAQQRAVVEIRVSDQGPGIPPTNAERIFERFVRGTAGADKQVRGSGIGLALVEAHRREPRRQGLGRVRDRRRQHVHRDIARAGFAGSTDRDAQRPPRALDSGSCTYSCPCPSSYSCTYPSSCPQMAAPGLPLRVERLVRQ